MKRASLPGVGRVFYLGRLPAGNAVAVVGTRDPVEGGVEAAEELSCLLAKRGVVVVSGGARGVDMAAHDSALRCGGWVVTAAPFLWQGNRPWHEPHVREAVVSQFIKPVVSLPWHLVQRNKLIAALSKAVVVADVACRDLSCNGVGTLYTVAFAVELKKPVIAIRQEGPGREEAYKLVERLGGGVVDSVEEAVERLELLLQLR